MDRGESTPIGSTTNVNRPAGTYVLETSLGLKRLADSNDIGEFSRFQNERRLVSVEREMKLMKELI